MGDGNLLFSILVLQAMAWLNPKVKKNHKGGKSGSPEAALAKWEQDRMAAPCLTTCTDPCKEKENETFGDYLNCISTARAPSEESGRPAPIKGQRY